MAEHIRIDPPHCGCADVTGYFYGVLIAAGATWQFCTWARIYANDMQYSQLSLVSKLEVIYRTETALTWVLEVFMHRQFQ